MPSGYTYHHRVIPDAVFHCGLDSLLLRWSSATFAGNSTKLRAEQSNSNSGWSQDLGVESGDILNAVLDSNFAAQRHLRPVSRLSHQISQNTAQAAPTSIAIESQIVSGKSNTGLKLHCLVFSNYLAARPWALRSPGSLQQHVALLTIFCKIEDTKRDETRQSATHLSNT